MRLNNIYYLQGKSTSSFFNILLAMCCCSLLLVFFSCSNDYEESYTPDIIIGKWKIFRQFESNIEVDISLCDATWIIEFKDDKSIDSYESEPQNYPDECPAKTPQSGWNWINRGNNQYEIRYLEEQGAIDIFYRDNDRLVRELHNGITKVIYESYN